MFVLDGAVIVGTAAQAECDRLCVVTAPFETSVARIVARDGISAEMAARRLNAQTPESTLTAQADYVLRNDSSLAHLQAAAEQLCTKLLAEGGDGKRALNKRYNEQDPAPQYRPGDGPHPPRSPRPEGTPPTKNAQPQAVPAWAWR